MTLRLVILDADGTLRRTLVPGQPCPHGADEWEALEGARRYVSALPGHVQLGVASNQDHVGYGLLSYATAHGLLMAALERASGRRADPSAVRLCPHRPDVGCRCRKPAPGMLLDILDYFQVDRADTLFIGNELVDQQAASNARVPFAWAQDLWAD
jgi:D-glycero-D-manno-heptose 1,7-bisphosphate phosphatase